MNAKMMVHYPGTMAELVQIEEARKAAGFRNGYGAYVAAGMPGKELHMKPIADQGDRGLKRCQHCGKLFRGRSARQRFCSVPCQERAAAQAALKSGDERRQREYEKDLAAGTAPRCVICGKLIHPHDHQYRHNWNICSPECREEQHRIYSREYKKKKREAAQNA